MSDDRHWPGTERPHGGRLDEAIDRAVRRMMDVDPPAGIRRRVLARLEAPPQRAAWVTRFAYAGAALALIVIATAMLRDVPTTPADNPASPATAVPVPAPATSTTPGTAAPPARAGQQAVRRPPPPQTTSSRPVSQPSSPDRRIAAASVLDDPEFAAVRPASGESIAPPQPDPIDVVPPITTPAPIEIAPLVIEPLRIDPLPPRK